MSQFQPSTQQLNALKAIPAHQLKRPSMPIARYLQEANDLAVWSRQDREKLLSGGLNPFTFDQMEQGFELLKYFELHSKKMQKQPLAGRKLFQEKLNEGQQLQRELARGLQFAFRNHPLLKEKMRRIVKRSPHAALFQSLNDLAILGESQLELLEKIGFNPQMFGDARRLADELPALKADLSASVNDSKEMRDRAYRFLKTAVDELYQSGRYIFRNEPSRQKGYFSSYMQNKSSKRKRLAASKKPPQ